MYAVTRMKKMTRAWIAFLVTLEPQVAPTWLMLTSLRGTWAASARAAWTFRRSACCWSAGTFSRSAVTWICFWPLSWLVSWTTVGEVTPAALAASVAWATVSVWDDTSHERPPLKSMPSLSPWVNREMMPTRMMTAETPNHQRRLPMKSNDVSPR